MSQNGPEANDPRNYESSKPNSWESSLGDSSLNGSSLDDNREAAEGGGSASPFSREGSQGSPAQPPDNFAPPPAATPSRESWPTYPENPATGSPRAQQAPSGPDSPYGSGAAPPSYPGYDPSAIGEYGAPTSPSGPPAYGSPPPPYAQAPGYGTNPPQYGVNPYEVNPYQPAYGAYSPYGVVAQQHPQATTALILGIVGLAVCPFVGIGGLVLGGKVRKAIDAEPQRYSGRGLATAGFVLGILSVVYSAFVVLFLILGFSGAFDS